MKFVAFQMPKANWDDMDWLYNLIEDKGFDFDFFLIEAKTAKEARDMALDELFKKALRAGGVEYVIENAFWGFSALEFGTDEELLQFLGEKDGRTALGFYEKYTWEAFADDKVKFYDGFAREDQDKFFAFDQENLKKLYKIDLWYHILVAPITKVLGNKTKGV